MNANFNREAFVASFEKALKQLTKTEKVTKELLRDLSRTVLEAVHSTGDIGYVNRLNAVLTPVNRRVSAKFFEHFTGFHYDTVSFLFTKKSKKRYDEALKNAIEFLADPHQNLWTWAERNIEIERKDFTVDKVSDIVKKALKKNISQADILKAVLSSGIELDTLIEVMGTIVPADKQEATLDHVAKAFGYDANVKG